ncbi:MAG: PorV/PorQ family protein [bacterium]
MKSIAFIILLTSTLAAQEFKKTATSGFVFLEIPVSARVAALGETSLALPDQQSSGVFSNPASLGFIEQIHSASFSYSPWIAEMKHYASSYSYKSPFGTLAASIIMFDYGTMERTVRSSGQQVYETLGNFSASGLCVGLTFSQALTDRFAYGITAKYVREGIDIYYASNVIFDGGILYNTGFQSLRIGASIQNFGTDAKYLNDPFRMPSMLKLGFGAEVLGDRSSEYRITGLVEAIHPSDGDERITLGGEAAWRNLIILRGGYKFFYDEETFSVGLGIRTSLSLPVTFDVAYSEYGRLGGILRLTLELGLE